MITVRLMGMIGTWNEYFFMLNDPLRHLISQRQVYIIQRENLLTQIIIGRFFKTIFRTERLLTLLFFIEDAWQRLNCLARCLRRLYKYYLLAVHAHLWFQMILLNNALNHSSQTIQSQFLDKSIQQMQQSLKQSNVHTIMTAQFHLIIIIFLYQSEFIYLSMDIASQIRKTFETLVANEQFAIHLLQYTRSALQTIFNIPQSQQIDTPPSYIILLSHIINTGQSIQSFISSLPKQAQSGVSKIINQFLSPENEKGVRIDNSFYNNLCDVQWQMLIENGREIWEVKMFTFENMTKPFVLRLNYEQLSVLTFQVSQIVNQITQIQKK